MPDSLPERTRECASDQDGDDEGIRLLMVGRLTEKKGTLMAIDVFDEIVRRCPGLRLTIIGKGPLRDDIDARIMRSVSPSSIRIIDEMPNREIIEAMLGSDILLHTSITASDGDSEGIPNVVMEAMAHGLPVVASDNGGTAELVEERRTGLLFPEKDVEACISKLDWMIRNLKTADVDRMRDAAFMKVRKEFSIMSQTALLESIYSDLLRRDADG